MLVAHLHMCTEPCYDDHICRDNWVPIASARLCPRGSRKIDTNQQYPIGNTPYERAQSWNESWVTHKRPHLAVAMMRGHHDYQRFHKQWMALLQSLLPSYIIIPLITLIDIYNGNIIPTIDECHIRSTRITTERYQIIIETQAEIDSV